ncbi:MAG TPA: hypothetical protein VG944_17690 [Fimbriimonas sp.]|nr:hypothetical protein [Fimbriimonas sp.]
MQSSFSKANGFAKLRRLILPLALLLLAGCGGTGSTVEDATGTSAIDFHTFYVYTANTGSNSISEFQGNQDGTLTYLGQANTVGSPNKILVQGDEAYVLTSDRVLIFNKALSGNLNQLQSFQTIQNGTVYTPISVVFENGISGDFKYAMVLAKSPDGKTGILQRYQRAIDGTVRLTGTITGIKQPKMLGGNVDSFVTVEISGDNTVTTVDFGKMAVLATNKISAAASADPAVVETNNSLVYFIDKQSGQLVRLRKMGNKDSINGYQLDQTLKVGSPIAAGTANHWPLPLGLLLFYPMTVVTIDKTVNGLQGYLDSSLGGTMVRVPGFVPDAGTNPTAVNGVWIQDNQKHLWAYTYSTTNDGSLRFSKYGAQGGIFVTSYNVQGTGVSDVAVTEPGGALTPLAISPDSLSDGKVGSAYSQALDISGGEQSQPQSVKLVSGSLPTGLKLTSNKFDVDAHSGVISGTPTKAGAFNFTVEYARGTNSKRADYTITVSGSTSGGIPAYFVNDTTYSLDTTLNGFVGTILFQATQGAASAYNNIPPGNDTFSLNRPGSSSLTSKSFTASSGKRYVVIAVGNPADGYDLIQDSFDLGAKPPSGDAWFTFYPGVKSLTEKVDFYLVPPGLTIANTPYKVMGVAPITTTQTLAVPVSGTQSVTIIATESGQPTSVIAQQTVSLTSGASLLGTLVSPDNTAPIFDVTTDVLK